MPKFLTLIAILLVADRPAWAQVPLATSDWPAAVAPRESLPSESAYQYAFTDAEIDEIERWLSWIRIEIPVDVSGRMSGWVWAQRSSRGWLDWGGYRLEGEITSPELVIESWSVRSARLRFGYAAGTWYVGRLSGEAIEADNSRPVGVAELAAKLPIALPRTLEISGEVSGFLLQPLLEAFDQELEIENVPGNLAFAARVPLQSISDPAAWQARATFELPEIEFANIPPTSLRGAGQLDQGDWSIVDAQIVLGTQQLQANLQGRLESDLPFTASAVGVDLDLQELLISVNQVSLAEQLAGQVEFSTSLSGNASLGIESISASLQSSQLVIAGETLRNLELRADHGGGQGAEHFIRVQLQSAAIAEGNLQGSLRWQTFQSLTSGIPDQIRLNLQAVDLAQLSLPLLPIPVEGVADGQLHFMKAAVEESIDWNVETRLRLQDLTVAENKFGTIYLQVSKADKSSQVQATLFNAPRTLQAQLAAQLISTTEHSIFPIAVEDYNATTKLDSYQMNVVIGPGTDPYPVLVTGNMSLAGSPSQWIASGRGELSRVELALADNTVLLEEAVVNIEPTVFRLEQFRVSDQRGRIAGSALVRRDAREDHLLNLRIVGFELSPYLSAFAPTEIQGGSGRVSLEMRLRKNARIADLKRGWQGELQGSLSEIAYRDVPVGELEFAGLIDTHQLQLDATGSLLGGAATVEARLPVDVLDDAARESARPGNGMRLEAALAAVDLTRLMSLFFGPRHGAAYEGRATLRVTTNSVDGEDLGYLVSMDVPHFAYERLLLAKDLSAAVQYQSGLLSVTKLAGEVTGGRVKLRGSIGLGGDSTPSGRLQFDADRLQISGLVALLNPDLADEFDGVISYRGRLTFGRQTELFGSAHIRDGRVYQLPLQEVRGSLNVGLTPTGQLRELVAHDLRGTAVGGGFRGEVRLRGGASYQLETSLRVDQGRLEQLSRSLGFEHIVGRGTFDAFASLRSNDAPNLAALTGPLHIDFENGDAQSVPILSDLGRLVPVMQLASTDIKNGTMDAQFGQGLLRIQSLFLDSNAFWVVADGSASLSTGRLDINALLQTGGGIEEQLQDSATQKLVAAALPEVAFLLQLGDLLRNRAIYFHVAGTTSRPAIQFRAAQTIAKALLQNIRRQLLVAPNTTAAGNAN